MTARVTVVNVGCGNTASVLAMLRRIGVPAVSQALPGDAADVLVLPGVGSWDAVMTRLNDTGWSDAVRAHVGVGRPVLGICLGMQLLAQTSEEGSLPGLGLLPGHIARLQRGRDVRVPRVGWRATDLESALGEHGSPWRFYYSHSYAYQPAEGAEEVVVGRSRHGDDWIAAAISDGRGVIGCQFHPERSHRYGMAFLRRWCGAVGLAAAW